MVDDFKIEGAHRVIPRITAVDRDQSRKKKKRHQQEEAGRHFQELAQAAERAHEILERNKSSYRFCVYQQDGDTYIDVIIVDTEGKAKETFKKNITHDEFRSWVKYLNEEIGLIIDHKV